MPRKRLKGDDGDGHDRLAEWLTEIDIGGERQRGSKLAEQLARQIERQIVSRQIPEGEFIGSEAAIIEQLGVSRAVYREAVRLLEHHGIAEVRWGPRGGLAVTRPNPEAVTRSIALHLDIEGVTASQLFDARQTLELRAIELAADRMDEAGTDLLRRQVESHEAAEDRSEINALGHDFHTMIAQMSGSPVLHLFISALAELTDARIPDDDSPRDVARHAVKEHREITEALASGDGALARLRMLKHLDKNAKVIAKAERRTRPRRA